MNLAMTILLKHTTMIISLCRHISKVNSYGDLSRSQAGQLINENC